MYMRGVGHVFFALFLAFGLTLLKFVRRLRHIFSVPLIWVRPASTFCNTLSRALNRFPSSSSSFFSLLFHDKLRRVFFLATHIDILKAVERVLTYLLSSSDELKTIALFKNLNYEDLTLHYVLSWPLF